MADRRTVLRTSGGLLVGGALSAVAGCTDDVDGFLGDGGTGSGGGEEGPDGNESSDAGVGGADGNESVTGETIDVSHPVAVQSAVGEVGDGVETISLIVSLDPESDPIDLAAATFDYEDDEAELFEEDDVEEYDEATVATDGFVPGTPLESFAGLDVRDLDGNSFSAGDLADATLETDNHLEIVLDLTENEALASLEERSAAGFSILTPAGKLTYEILKTPSTLFGDEVHL